MYLQAHVAVLLNDAVGTFAGGRYEDEDVMIGVILGTGTNACYLEKRANVQHAQLPAHARSDSMLINTEWGSYYSDLLPVCAQLLLRAQSVPNSEKHIARACCTFAGVCFCQRGGLCFL